MQRISFVLLKSLRQKNNKTQDDLVLFLVISSQAVSKWEHSEGFPDITLLPGIAGRKLREYLIIPD